MRFRSVFNRSLPPDLIRWRERVRVKKTRPDKMPFWRQVILRIAALAAVLAFALVGATAPARAHATLVSADPADGALLETAPNKLWLTFSEDVKPLQLQLTQPTGEVIPLTPTVTGKTLVVDTPSGLGTGTHFLSWRVISQDGHPIGGTVLFSIGRVTANATEAGKVSNAELRNAIWCVKILVYVALFFGIGGAFFRAWMDDDRDAVSVALPVMLVIGLGAAIVSLGLQGLDVLGRGFDELVDRATWHAAWRTSYGTTVLIAVPSFIAALLSLMTWHAAARMLSLLALGGVGLALAASGHASAAAPEWLTRPAVFTHGVAIALWLGALVPLGLLLWRSPAEAAAPLRRFSRSIPFAVTALVVSGLVLAVIQLETLSALWTTDYGLVLLQKLVLLLPVFALAALNRWWFTARTIAFATKPATGLDAVVGTASREENASRKKPDARSARALTCAIGIETVLVVVVLAIVASWRFTPPPRTLTLANSTAMAHIHTGKAMAEITVRPHAAGPVAISIMVLNGEFAPLDPKEVTLSLSLPSAGIEPITRTAQFAGDNTWTIDGLVVPAPGVWTARVDILISDFETLALEQPIVIGVARQN